MGIGANSMCSEYKSAFRYILTASSFPVFIKEVREYAENVYRLKYPIKYMDIVSAKMRKKIYLIWLLSVWIINVYQMINMGE